MTPRYEEFAPDDAIASHVHRLWLFEGTDDGAEQAVPPDGRCELIAHVGVPYEERDDDGAWRTQPRLLFAGQLTRPLVLRAHGAVAVVAVRFTAAGAWAFAGRPLSSFTDRRVALAELVALSGLGERQLQRRFADVVGISPRMLASVVRLLRVFDALRDAPLSNWSERAQEAGFFDHPQMARDFRRLLGLAPRQWAAAPRGLSTSLAASNGERCRKATSGRDRC